MHANEYVIIIMYLIKIGIKLNWFINVLTNKYL